MQPVEQSAYWQQYYEGAWAARATLLHEMMAEGERHPLRLIKRLEAHERLHRLGWTGAADNRFLYVENSGEDTELLPCGTPAFRMSALRGNFLLVPFHTTACLHSFIIDFINQHGPFDTIVELGCGYARNIFELWYNGAPRDIPYFGGEFTSSGVELAEELASLEHGINATFFHFNHMNPDLSIIPRCQRTLVFTMHTIEQVKSISASWFDVVGSSAVEVVCLHFEPFGFQIADLGPATEKQRGFFLKQSWNQNFVEALFAARDAGTIGIDYLATELFFSEPGNCTSLAIWHAPA